jgi:hypothetical protein
MHPYERWTIRRYLAIALKSTRLARPPSADKEIFSWIDSHSRLLGLPELASGTLSSRRRLAIEAPIHSARWKAWRVIAMGIALESPPNPSPLQKRLDWLSQACSLNGSQSRVLGLLARVTRTPEVRHLVEAINDRFDVDGSELQPFLGTNSERVELSAGGRLSELGLIDAQDSPSLSLLVQRLLSLPRFEPRRVSDLLLGEPARASLAWKDFEHLAGLRDLAARIVGSAGGFRDTTRRGANLLFYGPPGTGKSEFAKTLGAHLGFSVQFCGETGEESAEPNRRERIAALLIANPANSFEDLNRLTEVQSAAFSTGIHEFIGIAASACGADNEIEAADLWSQAFAHFFPMPDIKTGFVTDGLQKSMSLVPIAVPDINVRAVGKQNTNVRIDGRNGIGPIPKDCNVTFEIADPSTLRPGTSIDWMVRNEGTEAEMLNDLGHRAGSGLIARRDSAYTGTHYMDCILRQNGRIYGVQRVPVRISGVNTPARNPAMARNRQACRRAAAATTGMGVSDN